MKQHLINRRRDEQSFDASVNDQRKCMESGKTTYATILNGIRRDVYRNHKAVRLPHALKMMVYDFRIRG